jgi:hypothetical protein
MRAKRTCHPYRVLHCGSESHSYKHPVPLALVKLYGITIAAEQRDVYRKK